MKKTVKITYFVHGTTTDNEQGIATGWNHGRLSKLGKEQSVKLGRMIKGKKFDAVFCSDLRRAFQSAGLMFGNNSKIIRDRRLRECNYGSLNGTDARKVDALTAKSISKPFPKGESYKDVEKRLKGFLKYVKKEYEGKHIAVISHRGPQLALDVIVKGKTWKQAIKEDWRKKKAWKPGWLYIVRC